jgi:hypothetical protein
MNSKGKKKSLKIDSWCHLLVDNEIHSKVTTSNCKMLQTENMSMQ